MFPGLYLFPAFLAGAYFVAVPLLLHLLRRRIGRPVPLPSLFFLQPIVRSTRFHLWRRWLVLLLRCAALLLLAIAFARPYQQAPVADARATIVVVDRSFSMQSAERWAALQTWVTQQIGPAEKGDTLGIMAMSNHPTWLNAMTSDTASVQRGLSAMKPGWESARVEPTLRLAGAMLAASSAQKKRIVLLSDHQRLAWAGTDFNQQLPAGVNLIFGPPSPPAKTQSSLSGATVSRDASGRLRTEVSVHSYSASAQTRQLRVFLENDLMPAAQVTLTLAPQEERTVRLELPANAKPAWLRLMLDPDDLPADDTAYAVVPNETKGTNAVYLDAKQDNTDFDFLETALASTTALPPHLRPVPLPAGAWPHGGVAILRQEKSFANGGAKLDAFLNAGGQAIILMNAKIADSPWWAKHGVTPKALVAQAEPCRVHDWALDHPVVAPLAEYGLRGLLGWKFRTGWSFARTTLDPIGLWTDDTVAIGELRVGAGRLIVCGFSADRRESDWPIEEGFVPFLHRAVTELLHSTPHGARLTPLRVGEPVTLPPGPGQWRSLAGPSAGLPPLKTEGEILPTTPGLYVFEHGTESSLFAVNVSAEESDLTPWTEGRPWQQLEQVINSQETAKLATQIPLADWEAEEKSGLWWWCVAILGLLLFLELAVANRTTR